MKSKTIISCLFILAACGKPKMFVLKTSGKDKYYLSDSIKIAFRKGYAKKAPLIAIDGVPFDYQKNLDTIILPLMKNQITAIGFVNKNSSSIIYGADAENGAVVINTTALLKYTTDTTRAEKGEQIKQVTHTAANTSFAKKWLSSKFNNKSLISGIGF